MGDLRDGLPVVACPVAQRSLEGDTWSWVAAQLDHEVAWYSTTRLGEAVLGTGLAAVSPTGGEWTRARSRGGGVAPELLTVDRSTSGSASCRPDVGLVPDVGRSPARAGCSASAPTSRAGSVSGIASLLRSAGSACSPAASAVSLPSSRSGDPSGVTQPSPTNATVRPTAARAPVTVPGKAGAAVPRGTGALSTRLGSAGPTRSTSGCGPICGSGTSTRTSGVGLIQTSHGRGPPLVIAWLFGPGPDSAPGGDSSRTR